MTKRGCMLALACLLVAGCATGNDAYSAPRAGIEPDPVRDPQADMYCLEPQRAFNREAYPVVVYYTERWFQTGPGCNTSGTQEGKQQLLAPGQNLRLFCTRILIPGSTCADHWRHSDVHAVRQ